MPDYSFAEILLSFFTTPERAAAIAGDFQEEARSQGSFWFWRQVIRTSFSLCLRQLMATPAQFVLLLVFGNLFIDFCPRLTVTGVRETFAAWNAHTLDPQYFTWQHLFMTRLIGPLMAGLMLAALSRGREVTICGAFALSRLFLFLWSWNWFRMNEFPLAWTILALNLLTPILLLTTAVWVRRSNLRVAPPPKIVSRLS